MAVDEPEDNEEDDQAGAGNPGGNDATPHLLNLLPPNPTVMALKRQAAMEMTLTATGKDTRMRMMMTQVRVPPSPTLNRRTP